MQRSSSLYALGLHCASCCGFLLLLTSVAFSSVRADLNGQWQFRLDPDARGEHSGWTRQIPEESESVIVPHTWNIGVHEDYEGTAWYFKGFTTPEDWRAKHVELHFGATFYHSRVWLNGVLLGTHEGGHTAYFFDITPHLKRTNFLAVEINNQPTLQSIPGWAMKLRASRNLWYDWWHYGGIVRDVWLTLDEPTLIRRQQIRSKLEGSGATLTTRIFLENFSRKTAPVKLSVLAQAPDGRPAATPVEVSLSLAPGSQDATVTVRIDSPLLWHFDEPNLYRLQTELRDQRGNLLDSLADNFGIRTIEIRDRRLYLNGEPVRLTGMTRHEESPWEGLAESRGTIKYDYDDMKNLQMTLSRPVHYPQHPAILDYCDRNGILLMPEIPMWQFSEQQMADPKVLQLAQQMVREMIEEAFNHPSIIAWSVCNESATDTPGGRGYFKKMYDFIKSIDPYRYVTYADDRIAFVENPADNAASLADFIMWNQYFGTWHGPASLLPAVMERIKKNYPDKMVIISELGAPGVFAPETKAADKLRAQIFREQMEMVGKQEWIAGVIMWCYQDYKSHRNLWPGLTAGYVDHGVVDENRQRRPSYEVWRELNAPAHVHIEWRYGADRHPPLGFRATIERRRADEIPSYTLRNYRLTWELRDDDNNKVASGEKTFREIGPPQTVESSWEPLSSKSLRLQVRLYRPTGFVALERTLPWSAPRSGGFTVEEMKRQGIEVPE